MKNPETISGRLLSLQENQKRKANLVTQVLAPGKRKITILRKLSKNIFVIFSLLNVVFDRRSSSSCSNNSKEDGNKKAKIGITIKKSPNSDRTFESRLLDQEFDNMSIKNKILDIG